MTDGKPPLKRVAPRLPFESLYALCKGVMESGHTFKHVDEFDLMSVAYHASFGSNTFCTPCVPDWRLRQKAIMEVVGAEYSAYIRKLTPNDGKAGELVKFELVPGMIAGAEAQQRAMEYQRVYAFLFATRFGIAGILMYNLIRETSEQQLWDHISRIVNKPEQALLYAALKLDTFMMMNGGDKEKSAYEWLRYNVSGESGDRALRLRVVADTWRTAYGACTSGHWRSNV